MKQVYLQGLKDVSGTFSGALDVELWERFEREYDQILIRLAFTLRSRLRRKTQRPWYPSDGGNRRRRRRR